MKSHRVSNIFVKLSAFAFVLAGHAYTAKASVAPAADAMSVVEVDVNSSLKDIMKLIGSNFKTIGKTFSDLSQADSNAGLAAEAVDLFRLAAQKTPETVSKLPVDQQAAKLKEYQDQILNIAGLVQKLTEAFKAKDSSAITSLLTAIREAKQKGHDEFKPEEG